MNRKLLLRLVSSVSTLAILLTAPALASATQFYVSLAGNNNNNGTSTGSAFRTIEHCGEMAGAGDTCTVLAGDFSSQGRVHIYSSGSASALLTFNTQGGNVKTKGFTIVADYVKIDGFEITGTINDYEDGPGIYLAGQHCDLRNNNIHDVTLQGLLLVDDYNGTSSFNYVSNNTITHAGQVGLEVYGQENTFENNDISHITKTPVGVASDADGVYFFGANQWFINNRIHDIVRSDTNNSDTAISCFQTWGPAETMFFDRNTCILPDDNTVAWVVEDGNGTVSGMKVTNNVAYAMQIFSIWGSEGNDILFNTFASNLGFTGSSAYGIELHNGPHSKIMNNIFYDIGHKAYHYIYKDSASNNDLMLGYNLVYNHDGSTPTGSAHTGDKWNVNPLFVDPLNATLTARDYHLQSTSQAIDYSYSILGVLPDYVNHDKEANARPAGTASDLGAFEKTVCGDCAYDYYVNASSGNDNNTGLTANTAFRTFGKLLSVLHNSPPTLPCTVGFTGDFSAETTAAYPQYMQYTGRPIIDSAYVTGTVSAPITLRAVTANGAKTRGFTIKANYITVSGFEIANTPSIYAGDMTEEYLEEKYGAGVIVENGSHNTVSNNYIHDTTRFGIAFWSPSDSTPVAYNGTEATYNAATSNRIENAGYAGIYVSSQNNAATGNDISHTIRFLKYTSAQGTWKDVGDANGIIFLGTGHSIVNNIIHDINLSDDGNSHPGQATDPDLIPHIDCFQTWGPAIGILLDRNACLLTDASNDGMQGFNIGNESNVSDNPLLAGVRNLTITNNVVFAFRGINTGDYDPAHDKDSISVFNNTFASSPAWTGASAYGVEFHNVKNAKLQNNIFYNIGHNTAPYVFVDAVRDGLTVGNNLVYDSDGSAPVLPEASIPRSGDVWQPSLGPKFANAAVYDYHLQSGSPAINAGTNVSNGHDKDNYTRTSGSYDIGAYEYH